MYGPSWRMDEIIKNKENLLKESIFYVRNRKDALSEEIQKLSERDKMILPHIRDLDIDQVINEFIDVYLSGLIDIACESKDVEEFTNKSSEIISNIELQFNKKKIGKPVSNLAIDISMALVNFGMGIEYRFSPKESGARHLI